MAWTEPAGNAGGAPPSGRSAAAALAVCLLAAWWAAASGCARGEDRHEGLEVKILYCRECNQDVYGARVAEEIREAFGVEAQLVRGFLGVFDVHVNGEIVYSRWESGYRFPAPGEVAEAIKKRYEFDKRRGRWVRRRRPLG